MDTSALVQLQSLPQNAVFGLISDSSRECLISYSSSLKSRIGQILDDNQDIIKEDTRLVIFDTVQDMEYKLIYAQYYRQRYLDMGYKNVGSAVQYINYRVKVQFSTLLNEVLVMLVNKRKDKTVVGVFKSVDDANSFVEQYYTGKDIVLPVYAINKDTRSWVVRTRYI